MCRVVLACALLLTSAVPARAGSLILVAGGNSRFEPFTVTRLNQTGPVKAVGVGFSTARDISDAELSIELFNFFDDVEPELSVFLTTRLGPGTTSAEEIASAVVSPAVQGSGVEWPRTISPVSVLSGLTLPAGSYYLTVLEKTPGPRVYTVSSSDVYATRTLAAGITVSAPFLYTYDPTGPDLYGNDFAELAGMNLWFSLEGVAASPPVPEPATLLLLGTGLAGAVARRRPRR